MKRRQWAVLLCAVLICTVSFAQLAAAAQQRVSAALQFETSLISLDTLDDSNEGAPASRSVDWSSRAKQSAKMMPALMPRRVKLTPTLALSECVVHARQGLQDLFRFQEVCRI